MNPTCMSRVFFLLLPMLKNVNSQIGQGSQNERIELLRSEKKEIQKFFNENPGLCWPTYFNLRLDKALRLKCINYLLNTFAK